jgi:hypothetical protein
MNQIFRGERIRHPLEGLRIATLTKGVAGLRETNAGLSHLDGQPVVLIQADPGGEGKVRADPDEHGAPLGILQIEVILIDPAIPGFQVPAS